MFVQELKHLTSLCTRKELRKFGITLGVFFALVTALLVWRESALVLHFAVVSGLFLVVGLTIPMALKPVYLVWMGFATIMGFFMTRVILVLVYGLAFIPAGVIARLLGKDLLKERFDPQAASYWVKRERRPFVPEAAEKQY